MIKKQYVILVGNKKKLIRYAVRNKWEQIRDKHQNPIKKVKIKRSKIEMNDIIQKARELGG